MATITQNHDRVNEATPSSLNEKIKTEAWQQVAAYAGKSNADISARIETLNKEWDIERVLGVNMSTLALTGAALAYFVHINWLILTVVVLAFFFQHAVQGWCPPLPVLRMLKVRSSKEIEEEKYALKVLRGDFDGVITGENVPVERLRQAVEKN